MKQRVISDALWNVFLLRLREYRWKGLVGLTRYNEPSVVPGFERFVEGAAETGGRPLIFTNGDRPEEIYKWLEAGASRIIVTEHVPKKEGWLPPIRELVRKHPVRVTLQRLQPEHMHTHAARVTVTGHEPMRKCRHSDSISINIDGFMSLCCLDYGQETRRFGSIETSSIEQLWSGEQHRAAREAAQRGEPLLHVCRICLTS